MIDKFSPETLSALVNSEDTAQKQDIVEQVALFYKGGVAGNEKVLVEDILTFIANSVENDIKKLLVEHLADYKDLNPEIAKTLARDLDLMSIAAPILQHSPVFSDLDLIELIEESDHDRQCVIANRKTLSDTVSRSLVKHGDHRVVNTLTNNPGAELSTETLHEILDRFELSSSITDSLTQRRELPLEFAERLITMVTESAQEFLLSKYDISEAVVNSIMEQSREKATIRIIQPGTPASHVERLVRHLNSNKRLTDGVMIRAICSGDNVFFEYAISQRTQVPLRNVQRLLYEGGHIAIEKLLRKAGLDNNYHAAAMIALDVYAQTIEDNDDEDTERFSRRVIERLLTDEEHTIDAADLETIDQLLSKLSDCSPASAAAV